MSVPVILSRERLIDAIVKVFIVREDDMATHVVELEFLKNARQPQYRRNGGNLKLEIRN